MRCSSWVPSVSAARPSAVPDHLAQVDGGVRTTQVIAPGYACPSNRFLSRALDLVDGDLLYVNSANRSRHLTGAPDEPAHWRADGLRAEFGGDRDFVVLAHPDEAAARRRYPLHSPMSTTILAFHKVAHDGETSGWWSNDRFAASRTAAIGCRAGGVRSGDCSAAVRRLELREYPDAAGITS